MFDKGQHHKDFFTIHKQGMGFTLCNHHKKHPQDLEIGLRKVASQSNQNMKDKRSRIYRISRRFDLWIELDFDEA